MERMKVLGTEKRTVVAEIEPIEFNRRVYRNEAGERVKPLDLASGLELYIRRDQCVQEIEIILAARSDLRNTAMICTRITGAKVSPATLGRDVHRVTGRFAESDRLFFPEEKGRIEADDLNVVRDAHADIVIAFDRADREQISSAEYSVER